MMPSSTASSNPSLTYRTAHGTWQWEADWPGLQAAVDAGIEVGRTMGIQYSAQRDELFIFHEGSESVLVCNLRGELLRAFGGHWRGAHGCSLVQVAQGEDYLWLTDRHTGRVEAWSPRGEVLRTLAKPPTEAYAHKEKKPGKPAWQPTWVAQQPGGAIWVADGYGRHQLHRYHADGSYDCSWSGDEDERLPQAFACPHAIAWDFRGGQSRLAVTDRGAKRLRWYDEQGRLLSWHDEICHSPSAFAFKGDLMAVPEMFTGVKIIRGEDETLADVGANPDVLATNHDGSIPADACVFPHACCWAGDDLFFVEGVDGGRVVHMRSC